MKACCESFKSRLAFACRHDAFFYFHNMNAFEAGDDLCIDLAAYKDNQIIAHLHRANLLFNLQAHEPAIPRRSDSAVFCGLAHWLVLTCLCCLPTGNLPVHIGNPHLPLADLSLPTCSLPLAIGNLPLPVCSSPLAAALCSVPLLVCLLRSLSVICGVVLK